MKLAVKLALGLMTATALVFSLFAWQLRVAQLRAAEQLVTASAERVCDIIRRSTRFQMLRNDREAMYRMIRDIGSEPGIRQIRIFSKTGQISFSTNESEISHVVDKSAEACYVCHAQAAPLEKLKRSDRARIFTGPGGERILGVILPVENQPDCANASCHVHPEKQKVLGVIDAQLSLAAVDREVADQQSLLLRFTAGSVAILGALSLGFIWLMVYRPMSDLIHGIRRVTKGHLDDPIPVRSKDEIGEMAAEFNHMTSELEAARTEITAWNRTLEDRVDDKTRELEQAHHSLLHSEKLASVGRLAATVAHEINNPLFGILTNARLAHKNIDQNGAIAVETKEKLTSKLSIIERESRRCGEIVKNLLMFSRQAPPHLETVAPDVVIERALALVRHSYELQNIEMDLDLQHGAALLKGDPGQLQQVLVVLLVNAAEAMQQQGGRVRIATRVEDKGRTLALSVSDTGPGVPPEVRDRIFEPFFSTKQEGPRTGLGLAIAQGIVEQHQGSIRLAPESSAGGTEFLIRLPIEQQHGKAKA